MSSGKKIGEEESRPCPWRFTRLSIRSRRRFRTREKKEGEGEEDWIRQELFSLAVVLAAVTAARSSLADHYYVPSGSMENSLIPGDRVFVDKTAYGFRIPLTKIDLFGARTPERGEIAVFDSPRDGTRLISASSRSAVTS